MARTRAPKQLIGRETVYRQQRERGITLFELAVVVLIAAVLAGLASLSARGLLTRTTVGRVQHDHHMLARALENYVLDYGKLPPSSLGLEALVRPTAYLGTIPNDPFQKDKASYLYLPVDHPDIAYLLISPGPNGRFDLPPELMRRASHTPPGDRNSAGGSAGRVFEMQRGSATVFGDARSAEPGTTPEEFTDVELAILRTYLVLGRYNPERGGNGDIVYAARH